MKKILAIVLALAMLAGLSVTSLADDTHETLELAGIGDTPFHYDADNYYSSRFGDHLMMANGYISYTAAAYYPIVFNFDYLTENIETGEMDEGSGETIAFDSDLIESLKIKAQFEQGGELVQDISIVKMRVNNVFKSPYVNSDYPLMLLNNASCSDYFYFIKIQLVPHIIKADETDVIGTLTLNTKAEKDLNVSFAEETEDTMYFVTMSDAETVKVKDLEVPVEFTARLERHWTDGVLAADNRPNKDNSLVDDDEVWVEYGKGYAFKFDYDDETEFTFGGSNPGDQNEGTFTVDVSGQGKIFMMFNTEPVAAIQEANPGVDMHFVNFNNAKFNRAGEFVYEMEDGVVAYKIVNGQLAEIPGCEYDKTDEAFSFKTNVLGYYVFADAELVNPAPAAAEVTAA